MGEEEIEILDKKVLGDEKPTRPRFDNGRVVADAGTILPMVASV